ncbi:MAG TPA: hypothetical protein V6D11_09405 [Waterburya sp.]|jgi:hemerythrin superfamily protein
MDIFELIEADHRKAESLFSEIEQTDESQKLAQKFQETRTKLQGKLSCATP